ncbi:M1 family metallopeptidase [Chengkuizengella axinellae]|uniref:M1 family metallopeptidase n=1 Tax=Chengkuizengella axinellae TaxID=3064388 RepID=A0ABT9IZ76_9BACL|nr:M1 family metallopeptidase [Chengkuizengella sp. 2205SS18-9]MDP5274675.1 M1 family metallopeptidase [Chengkuizengella sp. 2205SS18-9]
MIHIVRFLGYFLLPAFCLLLFYFIFFSQSNLSTLQVDSNKSYFEEEDTISANGASTQLEQLSTLEYSEPLSQRIVDYNIDVELDDKENQLIGSQTLTWVNPGKKPVQELFFHLYPNAFQSKKTSFIVESGGSLRDDNMKKNSYGEMMIHKLWTNNGKELSQNTYFIRPDDGNPHDFTLMGVKLPEPVLPGKQITLNMTFSVQMPYVFARMGYVEDFFMAGQWFPKVAVYELKGMRGREDEGWNLHQYHGNSEFYANFGTYDVLIKVPSKYIVAGSGTLAGMHESDNMKTYHFRAADVHDFAWSASPHFIVEEEVFHLENANNVKIKLYLDPLHSELKRRYFYAAKAALENFTKWYGDYPYDTLSIVVPPQGGNGAGGMEYPTLVTAWAAADKEPDSSLERVIIHEIGHQYWYGMVASNEFEEAWLDEGFTSYAEDKVMEKEYGIRSKTYFEASYITSPAALKQNAWDYKYKNEYAQNVYVRGKLVLNDIENIIGKNQMDHVLKTYFQQWKFKHPSTEDFQAVLEEVTNQSWADYFHEFIYGDKMVDYAIESLQINEISNPEEPPLYEHKVTINRNGAIHYEPVSILFSFSDGTFIEKEWEGTDKNKHFDFIHPSTLSWAAIDPDHTIILENQHINNFINTSVKSDAKIRWNLLLTDWIESVINSIIW